MRAGERCPDCDAPHEPSTKWNGGNVTTVMLPTCECEERRTEDEIERRFGRGT